MRGYEWLTGSRFEELILGKSAPVLTHELYASLDWKKPNKAIQQIVENYSGSPFNPETEYMRHLLRTLEKGQRLSQCGIRFYECIGTIADYFHGIDCFFHWKGRSVTIDLCLNPEKKREHREKNNRAVDVDFLLSPSNFFLPDRGAEMNEKAIDFVAEEIANQFQRLFRTPREFRDMLPRGIIVASA